MPSEDISKGFSRDVGDGANTCHGCLGRDSIANAAARVGPAVVNLSVPQGILHGIYYVKFKLFAEKSSFYIGVLHVSRFLWVDQRKEYRLWNYHRFGWHHLDLCSCGC